jgi:hypothetical protein
MNHPIANSASTEMSSGDIYVMGILEKICKAFTVKNNHILSCISKYLRLGVEIGELCWPVGTLVRGSNASYELWLGQTSNLKGFNWTIPWLGTEAENHPAADQLPAYDHLKSLRDRLSSKYVECRLRYWVDNKYDDM